jgi:hypothetical protein
MNRPLEYVTNVLPPEAKSKELNPDISQALYYAVEGSKFSLPEIQKGLRRHLFSSFSSDDDRLLQVRHSVVGEISAEYQNIDRNRAKDKEVDARDRQVDSLSQAVTNLVAMTTSKASADLDPQIVRLKLQMLRSLLSN